MWCLQKLDSSPALQTALLSNRAAAHLALRAFAPALADSRAVLALDPAHVKAQFREALALAGRHRLRFF